jgi:hypothetical protein
MSQPRSTFSSAALKSVGEVFEELLTSTLVDSGKGGVETDGCIVGG